MSEDSERICHQFKTKTRCFDCLGRGNCPLVIDAGVSEVEPLLIQLSPHENMTVEQCAGYVHRNADEFQDLIAVGYDQDGALLIRSSHMTRAESVFLLLAAVDWVRGISS